MFCQENALVIANTLLFTWGQTVVEVMKMMVTSLKRSHACAVTLSVPNPAAGHHHPTTPPETQTPTGKSGTVSCGVTAPFPWVLVHKVLLCPSRIYFPVLCKFWKQRKEASKRRLNMTKEALFDQRTCSKGTSGRKYHCFCKGIQMDNNFKNSEMKVT